MTRRVAHPITVHSIGFPVDWTKGRAARWLTAHDFGAPLEWKRGASSSAKYLWAMLTPISSHTFYRTVHWEVTGATLSIRYAIDRRRAIKLVTTPKKTVSSRRRASPQRRAG